MAQNFLTVTNIIQQFINQHKALNGRGTVATYDQLTNFAHEGTQFPIMYADIRDVYLDDNANVYTFRVYCVDLLQKDRSNEGYIRNHTLAILTDFRNWIAKDLLNNVRVLSNKPRAIPVNNFLMDYTSGWYFDIQVETTSIISDCVIPFNTDPQFTGTTCDINYVSPFLTCDTLQYCSHYIDIVNNSVNTISLSAGTIYSGHTDLYNIFATAGASQTLVQNGINTFTAGTTQAPSVNITGGTFNSISASTIASDAFLSGSTNINQLFGSGSNILFGKTDTVYLFGNANDAAAAGGPTNNAFTTFQAAYDRANQLATGTTTILLSVLNTSSGNTGDLRLSADFNTNIRIEGYSFNTSRLGSIITSASTGSSFNVGGTGLTQFVYLSNINLQNIVTSIGSSGSTNNGGRVRLALNNVLMQNINTSVPVTNWTGNGGGVDIGGSGGTLSFTQAIPNTTVGQVGNINTQARTTGGTAGSVTITAPYYNLGSITTAQNNFGGLLNLQNIGSIFGSISCLSNSSLAHQFTDISHILNSVTLSDTGGTKTISNIKHNGSLFTINSTNAQTFNIRDSTFTGQFQGNSATTINASNIFFSTTGVITVGGASILKNTNILGSFQLASGSTSVLLQGCQIQLQVFFAGLFAQVYNTSTFSVIHDIGTSSIFQNSSCIAGLEITGNNCKFENCAIGNNFLLNSSGITGTFFDTCAVEVARIPAGATVQHKNSYTQNVLAPIGAVNPNPGIYMDIEDSIYKLSISATSISAFTLSSTTITTPSVQPTQIAFSNSISGLTGSTGLTYLNSQLQVANLSNQSNNLVYANSAGTLSTISLNAITSGISSTPYLNTMQVGYGNSISGLTGTSLFTFNDSYLSIANQLLVGKLNNTVSFLQPGGGAQFTIYGAASNSITNFYPDGTIDSVNNGWLNKSIFNTYQLTASSISADTIYLPSFGSINSPGNLFINGGANIIINGQYFGNSNVNILNQPTKIGMFAQPNATLDVAGSALAYTLSASSISASTIYTSNSGRVILTGGTAVVNTTKITANSNIFMNYNTNSPTQIGVLAEDKSVRVNGTSFTITSSNPLDTSTVAWFIIEQY